MGEFVLGYTIKIYPPPLPKRKNNIYTRGSNKHVHATDHTIIVHPGTKIYHNQYGTYKVRNILIALDIHPDGEWFKTPLGHPFVSIGLDVFEFDALAVQTACEQINALRTRQWLSWRVFGFLIQM